MKSTTLVFLLSITLFSNGQTVSYDDVAVIVNDNSQTSIDIANYFQTARNIPNQNMIHINAPATEEIDSLQFQLIRTQIENYLVSNDLEDSINYIVTTKGVPLKISGGCFDGPPGPQTITCASFDSELCLILGQYANEIGQSGSLNNPFYDSFQHFSHDVMDIYLVTRLTGYTKEDVYTMIDRSGFNTGINSVSSRFILDMNEAVGSDSAFFYDNFITPADDYLINNSWNSQVDLNVDPVLNQTDAFAYVYYGYGQLSNISLNYNWTNGAIGIMPTAETAGTFNYNQNPGNVFSLGDVISEGCTGGMGYVNTTFYSLLFNTENVFERYLSLADDYNLAESFYAGALRMSWQSVIVGDPKASLRLDDLANTDEAEELALRLHPNPTQGIVRVQSNEAISSVQIYSTHGKNVRSIDGVNSNEVELDLYGLKAGVYLVHIFSDDKMKVERVVMAK